VHVTFLFISYSSSLFIAYFRAYAQILFNCYCELRE